MKTFKICLIIFFLFLSTESFANKESTKGINYESTHKEILELQNANIKNSVEIIKVKEILKDIKSNGNIQKNTLESIFKSTNLLVSVASIGLAIIGFLITIGAIMLGCYIKFTERKIIKIRDESSEIFDKIQNVKNEVEQINKNINSNLRQIYQRIKREETIDLLNRLVKVPKDIANIVELLLSRDLEDEDYILLKKAYLKADDYEDPYLALFLQHFLHFFVIESEEKIVKQRRAHYDSYLENAFENDLTKSSHDFIKGIRSVGLINFMDEINAFIKAVDVITPTQNRLIVIQGLFNALNKRKDQMEFYDIIDDQYQESKIAFGQLIVETYNKDTLSGKEQKTFLEIKERIES